MSPVKKSILLCSIDVVVVTLIQFVSYFASSLFGNEIEPLSMMHVIINTTIYISVFALCFRYSFKKKRAFYFDIIAVLSGTILTILIGQFLFEHTLFEYVVYYGFLFLFIVIFSILLRAFFTLSEDEEKEDGEEFSARPDFTEEENENTFSYTENIFEESLMKNVMHKDNEPAEKYSLPTEEETVHGTDSNDTRTQEGEPMNVNDTNTQSYQDELLNYSSSGYPDEHSRTYADELAVLQDEVREKEAKICALERKLQQAKNLENNTSSFMQNSKEEVLDKILEDIKSLYQNLNKRENILEEKEYELLLKLVQIEERERALEELYQKRNVDHPSRNKKTFAIMPDSEFFKREREDEKENFKKASEEKLLKEDIQKSIEKLSSYTSTGRTPMEESKADLHSPNPSGVRNSAKEVEFYDIDDFKVPVRKKKGKKSPALRYKDIFPKQEIRKKESPKGGKKRKQEPRRPVGGIRFAAYDERTAPEHPDKCILNEEKDGIDVKKMRNSDIPIAQVMNSQSDAFGIEKVVGGGSGKYGEEDRMKAAENISCDKEHMQNDDVFIQDSVSEDPMQSIYRDVDEMPYGFGYDIPVESIRTSPDSENRQEKYILDQSTIPKRLNLNVDDLNDISHLLEEL